MQKYSHTTKLSRFSCWGVLIRHTACVTDAVDWWFGESPRGRAATSSDVEQDAMCQAVSGPDESDVSSTWFTLRLLPCTTRPTTGSHCQPEHYHQPQSVVVVVVVVAAAACYSQSFDFPRDVHDDKPVTSPWQDTGRVRDITVSPRNKSATCTVRLSCRACSHFPLERRKRVCRGLVTGFFLQNSRSHEIPKLSRDISVPWSTSATLRWQAQNMFETSPRRCRGEVGEMEFGRMSPITDSGRLINLLFFVLYCSSYFVVTVFIIMSTSSTSSLSEMFSLTIVLLPVIVRVDSTYRCRRAEPVVRGVVVSRGLQSGWFRSTHVSLCESFAWVITS